MKRIVTALSMGLCLVGAGFWFGHATAQTNDPGTAGDPLVSRSYVDEMTLFRVVNVSKGQSVEGESGTQVVVRTGRATVIASSNGGMMDATGGVDLGQGAVAGLNHLLIVPRTEGRGLAAQTDLILMVKGPLKVK